jgi:hypothetical protein
VDVTHSQRDPVAEIIRGLRTYGFVAERIGTSDDYAVRPTSGDVFAYEPVLSLPPALLTEYLEQMSRDIHDVPDPFAEAVSITTVHLAEDLDTDHHGGRNYTRSVALHRKRDGRLVLLVDTDIPGVPHRERDPDLEWRAY